MQPVHRLPPELLAQVFEDVQLSLGWSWSHARDNPQRPGRATWIRLTWVCRHWRLVALGFPQLWSLIIVDHCPWTSLVPTLLERSKKIPLAVSIKHAKKDAEAILDLCLPHVHRLRRLAFEGPIGPLLAPLLGSLNALEEAHFSQNRADFFEAHSFGRVLFLPGHFPRLRILHLRSVDVAWETFSVPSLHELVFDLTWLRHVAPSATSALRIMGNSPELRVLKLPNFSEHLPSAAEDPQEETDVISLAYLEEITLTGSFGDVTYVLDHFTVPSGDCTIHIEYYGYWENVMPIEMVTPQQASFRSLLSHCTTIELDVNIIATISAFNEHGICFLDLKSTDYLAGVHQPTITQENWMSILDAFACAPLSRFSFTYSYLPHITFEMWTALFDRFSLEVIEIGLCGRVEERGRANRLDNLFDAMRGPASLQITTLEFTFLNLTWETIGAIFDLLRYRDLIEKPLETLVFSLCFCESTKHMEDLKTSLESYVDVVIWYDMDADTPADDFRVYDDERSGSFSSRWSIT